MLDLASYEHKHSNIPNVGKNVTREKNEKVNKALFTVIQVFINLAFGFVASDH